MKPAHNILNSFRRFRNFSMNRMAPPSDMEEDSLTYWRVSILFAILFSALIFCTFAMAAAIVLIVKEKLWGLAIFDLFAYVLCIVFLISPRPNYNVRASVTLFMFYLVGLAVIFSVGPVSGGPVWLFTFAVLVGVLLGSGAAIGALCLNGVTLIYIAWIFSTVRSDQVYLFFNSWQLTVSIGVNFLVLNAITAMSVATLVKGLAVSHKNEKILTRELLQEQTQLKEANRKLEVEVAERKQTEAALRESEEKYRLLADNITDNIWIMDLDELVFTYVSPSVVGITGYTAEEATGFRLHDVLTPPSMDMAMKILADELASDNENTDPSRSVTIELEQYRKDNKTFWTEVSVRFIRDANGQPIGLLGVTRDVSERRRLREQLQQAQKMEAVGTLAGGIAHDFNNLLHAVSGFTQMVLLEKNETDPDYANLNAILQASDRAAQLVRQLLLFSRKVETEKKPVKLNHEIEQAGRILERTIPKMIVIEYKPESRLWSVNADPVQMEQILLNLGKNAADAMPDGGKLIFATENVVLDEENAQNLLGAEPGKYVLLTVSDNGQGMDKETIDHIFEPFYTTKDVGKGTGLGLASVYGIVRSHMGFITCRSEIGGGTTFHIYLPATVEVDVKDSVDETAAAPVGGTETILIVDDEEWIRIYTKKALMKYGYQVVTACSGEEALEVYPGKSNEIRLIIMDIGMPGMGGHHCLRELLNINPAAKIIISTGYSLDDQLIETLNAGAAGYVGKPYEMSDLVAKIRSVLDKAE